MIIGKSPFFPGLDDQSVSALIDESGSGHPLVDGGCGMGLPVNVGMGVGLGGGMPGGPQNPQLSSPSRSSPHSQGSETGERFSRKVFVGGLPPDIDEGK